MILGLLSLIKNFVFELLTDQSIALFEVEIIPYISLPSTVVDQVQPSHVYDSNPLRLIMSSKDPLLPEDGDPGSPGQPALRGPPPPGPQPGPPPGPPLDVSNEILISRVHDISRQRTIDIKYGMNLS